MIKSTRPRSREDRATCIDAVADFANPVGLQPIILAIVTTSWLETLAAYEHALERVDDASAEVSLTRTAKNKANTAFDNAFRLWQSTVVDADGKDLVGPLSVVLGTIPTNFLRFKPRTKLKVIRREITLLAKTPELRGDLVKLEAVRSAAGVLGRAVAIYEASLRVRRTAVIKFKAAAAAFDKVWGTLADAILKYDEAGTSIVPVFYRSATDPAVADDEEVEVLPEDREEAEEADPPVAPAEPAPEPAAAAPEPEPEVDPDP